MNTTRLTTIRFPHIRRDRRRRRRGGCRARPGAHPRATTCAFCSSIATAGPGNINRGESLLPPVTRSCGVGRARPRAAPRGPRGGADAVLSLPRRPPARRAPRAARCARPVPRPSAPRDRARLRRGGRGHVAGGDALRHGASCASSRMAAACAAIAGSMTAGGDEQEIRAPRSSWAPTAPSSVVRAALGIELPRIHTVTRLFILDIDRPAGHPDVLRTELHPDGGILVVPGVNRLGLAALVPPGRRAPLPLGARRADKLADRASLAPARRPPCLARRRPPLQALARPRAALLGPRRGAARRRDPRHQPGDGAGHDDGHRGRRGARAARRPRPAARGAATRNRSGPSRPTSASGGPSTTG